MLRKRLVIAALLLSFPFFTAEVTSLSFDWAFVKRTPDGGAVPIDFSSRVNINQDDLFKIYIRPDRGTFVYLYLYDASNKLLLLFPGDFGLFAVGSYASGRYFVPDGENWYALDNTRGTERFYLVASATRLSRLESLTNAYERLVASPSTELEAIGEAREAVLDELAELRAQHSELRAPVEVPVTIAGATRGLQATMQHLATHIEASDFYAKTFRLEH